MTTAEKQTKAPPEYLTAIRDALKASTDDWTDKQLNDYSADGILL